VLRPSSAAKTHALFAQDLLHALDGVAFEIEERADAAQEIDVFGPVEAPAARTLDRPDMGEARLPEAQHVLWYVERVGHFADRAERFRRFHAQRGGLRHAHSPASWSSGISPLITALSTWLGRNTSTRRGAIGTS